MRKAIYFFNELEGTMVLDDLNQRQFKPLMHGYIFNHFNFAESIMYH